MHIGLPSLHRPTLRNISRKTYVYLLLSVIYQQKVYVEAVDSIYADVY